MNAETNVKLLALITTQVHFYALEHTCSFVCVNMFLNTVMICKLKLQYVCAENTHYYTVLSIGNCQLYCFQSTLSKVTDILLINLIARATIFQLMA